MSLSKNRIKYIHALKDKKNRDFHNVFVAEGNKLVSELLLSLKCQVLIGTPSFFMELKARGLSFSAESVIEVTKDELNKISSQKNPQESLGIFYAPQYTFSENEIKNKLSLALDGIQDPGNMGTIIRLADWYGIENIFCSIDTVDAFNPKVVQATMGALARVKVHYLDLHALISSLKKENIPVYGTFLDGNDMYGEELTSNAIIVMGNEGQGIRDGLKTLITDRLYIPSYPQDRNTSESLNVAIATAIICSEFRRKK